MDAAKTLIRTTVRTFFPETKYVLIIDALLQHSVLHVDDFQPLLFAQGKEIRATLNPLKNAQLVSTHSRSEARVGSNRGTQREYYYINFHQTIDAIKYRIVKLRKRVDSLYQQDETRRKDWRCPRCKAEYDELTILDKVNEDGFYCDRCGFTLVQNEAAAKESGNHEKIRRLNTQLARFDEMIARVDRAEIPENDFFTAWEKKKEVPRDGASQAGKAEYVELKRTDRHALTAKKQEIVNAGNLSINLTTQTERDIEDQEAKEKRKAELAKQNEMPDWHSHSAIGISKDSNVKAEDDDFPVKKQEDESKPIIPDEANMHDEVAAYMAEMERERLEAERKAKEEEEDDDDDDDEFEDVVGTSNIGTPLSSQQGIKMESTPRSNGLKRELDLDADSASGTDTNANTPADSFDPKRVKLENGHSAVKVEQETPVTNGADSDEDEDFEDV